MNEKIKELIEECFEIQRVPIYTNDIKDGYRDVVTFNREKFAKLIVCRVISVYNDSESFKTSNYDDKRVLEYFGIEK